MQYILILAIFLVPISSIFPIKGTFIWLPQLLALYMMGGVAFASRFWKVNKFLAIFIAYLMFSYIFVTNTSLRTLLCLMAAYTGASFILLGSNLKSTRFIYMALIGMSLLSALYSILQFCGIDPIFHSVNDNGKDIVSFMGSHNQLGIYSAATAFSAPWIIPLSLIPIYLCKCNSALIGLFFGAIVYIYFLYGKKWLLVLAIVFLIIAIPFWGRCHKSLMEFQERVSLWKLTISQSVSGKIFEEVSENENHDTFDTKLIKANPFTGFGLGQFFIFSPLSQFSGHIFNKHYYTKGWGVPHYYEHAHNDFLEAWFEFGYIGLSILICLIISIVLTFINTPKTTGVVSTFSSLVAQSVSSLSVYVFHAPVGLFMFCLILGLFFREVEYAKT